MKRSLFAMLSLLAFSAATCHARIGETIAQVQARFNRSGTSVIQNRQTYEKNGFVIAVTFQDGISVVEEISKPPSKSAGDNSYGSGPRVERLDITGPEIESFLRTYGEGLQWTKEPTAADTQWRRSDQQIMAIFKQRRGQPDSLAFVSVEYAREVQREKDAQRQQAEQKRQNRGAAAARGF